MVGIPANVLLESRLLLNPLQTGFRSGHSTQTALLKLTDDIRLGTDKKLVTLLLLFDFSKAFDCLSRQAPAKIARAWLL